MINKKVLIFDFDGVICDSVNIKTDAFYQMYVKYGDKIAKKVKEYHLMHGGISRFFKIKYFHKEYLNIELNNSELNSLCEDFSNIVLNSVISSSYLPGVMEFIKKHKSDKKIYICTGTPQKEIDFILKNKNINDFFDGVYGSPDSKEFIINSIIKTNHFEKKDIVFFGDSETDLVAAKHTKIDFIAINYDNKLLSKDIISFPNFTNLL